MDNLAEIGKRVERLLYTSVLVMLASFLFYFLSSAITGDNSSLKKSMISSFIDNVNNQRENLTLAKNLQETYRQYAENNKNKTERQRKAEEDKKRLEIKNLNNTRSKLGLDQINVEKILEEKPSSYDGLDVKNINSLRERLNLSRVDSIDGAKDIYDSAYNHIIYKSFYGDKDNIINFAKQADLPIADIIKYSNEKLSDLDKGTVKVFDVDTPLQIPFSLGDMKSKVSLYNIETVGMIFMPVLLVIWLGSISMSRTREIYYIKKTRNIAGSYPHILNLYSFMDKDVLEKQSDISQFDQLMARDSVAIKFSRPLAIIYFFFRVVIILLLSLSMIVPFYLGAHKVISSLSTANVMGISVCFFINVIQLIALVFSETLLFKTIFIGQGTTNEYI